jgi:putative membrane protein
MKARTSPIALRQVLLLTFVSWSWFGATDADAKMRPRLASFASVARGAEIGQEGTDSLRPGERAFVRQAREGAQRDLRLAQLAASKAVNSDVRSYAQQVATDQRQIGESLEALSRRKGLVAGVENDPTTPGDYERLAGKSGAEFDREFVRLMLLAHENTLKVFEQVLSDGRDTEVRDIAGGYLPVVRDHLNKARELKKVLE